MSLSEKFLKELDVFKTQPKDYHKKIIKIAQDAKEWYFYPLGIEPSLDDIVEYVVRVLEDEGEKVSADDRVHIKTILEHPKDYNR